MNLPPKHRYPPVCNCGATRGEGTSLSRSRITDERLSPGRGRQRRETGTRRAGIRESRDDKRRLNLAAFTLRDSCSNCKAHSRVTLAVLCNRNYSRWRRGRRRDNRPAGGLCIRLWEQESAAVGTLDGKKKEERQGNGTLAFCSVVSLFNRVSTLRPSHPLPVPPAILSSPFPFVASNACESLRVARVE